MLPNEMEFKLTYNTYFVYPRGTFTDFNNKHLNILLSSITQNKIILLFVDLYKGYISKTATINSYNHDIIVKAYIYDIKIWISDIY